MVFNQDLERTRLEYDRAAIGIQRPAVMTLLSGEAVFRFASTRNMQTGGDIPSSEWARGAWWFHERDYQLVIERYKASRLSLGTVARSAAAVQPGWSNMDVSIKARVMQDIEVYTGKGTTQYRHQLPNGMFMTLPGWPDVQQIYIPDIRGSAFRALQILRQKIIKTDDFGVL